ncbi:hypothetical protein DFJ73DRAFT_772234 [Zopfochytrium polystomum]|nr:hypothetical protein DFJ73DRAFT_772234 [Zopfochytrium polystomum]
MGEDGRGRRHQWRGHDETMLRFLSLLTALAAATASTATAQSATAAGNDANKAAPPGVLAFRFDPAEIPSSPLLGSLVLLIVSGAVAVFSRLVLTFHHKSDEYDEPSVRSN